MNTILEKVVNAQRSLLTLYRFKDKNWTAVKSHAMKRVLKPFISEKSNGMGLGLHICKEIMTTHKGRIEFPEFGDYELPSDFNRGAQVLLVFKK